MDPTSAITLIFACYTKIAAMCRNAKSNKESIKLIGERCAAVEPPLRELQRNPQLCLSKGENLRLLLTAMEEIHEFVSQERFHEPSNCNWARNVYASTDDQTILAKLNKQLTDCLQGLGVGLQVDAHLAAQRAAEAAETDRREMERNIMMMMEVHARESEARDAMARQQLLTMMTQNAKIMEALGIAGGGGGGGGGGGASVKIVVGGGGGGGGGGGRGSGSGDGGGRGAQASAESAPMLKELDDKLLMWDVSTSIKIGQGSFGTVYKGRYDGQDVAIKHFPDLESMAPDDVKAIQREALVMQVCDHPNVLKFFGNSIEKSILVTELGVISLDDCLHKGKTLGNVTPDILSQKWKLEVCHDLAQALRYLHIHDILHRDIKPGNVMLKVQPTTGKTIAMLGGFSLSLALNAGNNNSKGVDAVGTLAYMAPELLQHVDFDQDVPYSELSDMYAFGILANELFTQKMPWKGARDLDVTNWVREGKRPPLWTIENSAGSDLREKLLNNAVGTATMAGSCLNSDPRVRPSAGSMCELLKPPRVSEAAKHSASLNYGGGSEDVYNELPEMYKQSVAAVEWSKGLDSEGVAKMERGLSKSVAPPGTGNQIRNATRQHKVVEVENLLKIWEHHAVINEIDNLDDGNTAAFIAAREGFHIILELLLKAGAEVDKPNLAGTTPFLVASDRGREDCVRVLIKYGAKVNQKNQKSFSAILYAAQNGHDKVLQLLVDSGGDVNAPNFNQQTALHFACMNNKPECVKILVRAGADIHAHTDKGKEPYELSKERLTTEQKRVIRTALGIERPNKCGCTIM